MPPTQVRTELAISDLNGNIGIYDSRWDPIASIRIEPPGQQGGQRLNGMVFSEDGATLYLFVDSEIQAYDTQAFQPFGYMAQPFWVGVPMPFAADSTGMIYATNIDGLDFIDASLVRKLGVPANRFAEIGYGMGLLQPNSGALSGGTDVKTTISTGVQNTMPTNFTAFIGNRNVSQLTSDANGNMSFTTSPGVASGPVDFVVQLADGTPLMEPKAFSYGPSALQVVTSAATPDGGGAGFLSGYGLSSPGLHISVGGQAAAVTQTFDYLPDPGPPPPTAAGGVSLTLPPGNPGSADVTISTADGSTTVTKGVRYVGIPIKHPLAASPEAGVYDSRRHVIYYSAGNQVQVLSTDTGQWQTPIPIPNAATAKLLAISISPDGSMIAVSDQGNRAIVVFNPDTPANSTKEFSVPDGNFGLKPAGLAITNQKKIYFLLAFTFDSHGARCQSDNFWKLDGVTGALTDLSKSSGWCVGLQSRVLLSPDQSVVYADPGGALKIILPGNDTILEPVEYGDPSSDMAVSADSARLIQADAVISNTGDALGIPAATESEASEAADLRYGQKLDRYGSILLNPSSNSLDLVDLGVFRNRERLALSFQMPLVFDSLVWLEDGQRAFLTGPDGVWEIPIGPMPLVLGSASPDDANGGSQITLHGNGFESGMTATVDDAPAPVSYIDPQTATIVLPTALSGVVHIAVSRADGQSSSLESAFSASGSAAKSDVTLKKFQVAPRSIAATGLGKWSKFRKRHTESLLHEGVPQT